jgi:hypothetical protein
MGLAVSSQPSSDGSLFAPMLQVLRDAAALCMEQLPVVAEVEKAFKGSAWCCRAMTILAKRPSFSGCVENKGDCSEARRSQTGGTD